ncbi:MAG: TonB-dependent receptor [Chitinophagaceae bacterium]|nr:TonB-dependent receptor [Chitinophagaceae bacterium]
MKKGILFLLLSIGFLAAANAQQRTLTGKLLSAEDGKPLAGVSILVKGAGRGTTSREDGSFTIILPNVSRAKSLVFSAIGFDTKEIPVQRDSNQFNVVLQSVRTELDQVIVGSRSAHRTKLSSPVPVDIIDLKPLQQSAPQVSLTQLLQYIAPSFHSVNGSNAGDAGSALSLAQLRGLGADQVLVLVNGKRRHKSANVNYGGLGNGTTGYDLNSLPTASIERVEILRDGAAAQYGSDAIAGVINIVLKKNTDAFTITSTGSIRRRGDGQTTRTGVNYGIKLGDNGGYLNATAEYATQGISLPAGRDNAGLYNGPIYGGGANTRGYDNIYTKAIDDSILSSRGIDRHYFDQRGGPNKAKDALLSFNLALPLRSGGQIYSFGGLSSRNSQFTAVYRLPGWTARNNNFIYPDGFLPDMDNNVVDKYLTLGFKTRIHDWNVDLSNVYGKNRFGNRVSNSLNASLGLKSPTTFDAGSYNASQNTTSLDIGRYFDKVLSGLNVAFGAQYRVETFQIIAGEAASYSKGDQRTIYDIDTTTGGITYLSDAGITSLNGLSAGSQIHAGFRPENAVNVNRAVTAGYADVELNLTKDWLVSGAVRLENFSDFGNVDTYKATTRYSFAKWLAIRGSYNTGFRAPDLAQSYYTSTSTTFQQGRGIDILTASNQSAAARALNIPKLSPERSKGITAGITSQPISNLEFSADAYLIDVNNRIGNTGNFSASDTKLPADVRLLFQQTGAAQANFFYNEFSTRTKGIEITSSYRLRAANGIITFLAGANISSNTVRSVNRPKGLDTAYNVVIFSPAERARVTTNIPATKITLQGIYNIGRFNFLARTVYFGKVTTASALTSTTYFYQRLKPIWVTDLSIGYKISENFEAVAGANNVFNVVGDYTDPAISGLRNPTVAGIQNGNAGVQPFIRVTAHL